MKNMVLILFLVGCGSAKEGPPGPAGQDGAAGVNGATGAMGATGSPGATGANGNSFDIQSKMSCFSNGPAAFFYYTALFTNGVRYTSCEITDTLNGYSSSTFYAAGQLGVTTGHCSVVYDIDTGTGGYWTFQMSPPQAQYHDIGSASDGNIRSFGPTDCTN